MINANFPVTEEIQRPSPAELQSGDVVAVPKWFLNPYSAEINTHLTSKYA